VPVGLFKASMARPKKEGLEYFSVDVDFDEKIDAIELMHHNDGVVWVLRFWQKAYKTMTGLVDFNGLFAELFSNKCRITLEKHKEILKTAIAVDFCHEVEPGIYTSNGIQKRISSVSKERAEAILRQEGKKSNSKGKKRKVKNCPDYSANNERITVFDCFRKQYPGSKRGLNTEYDNFCKKHHDYISVIPILETALINQVKWRSEMKTAGMFIPEWKNLQTWINQRCWEMEKPAIEKRPSQSKERPLNEYERNAASKYDGL
jgi:hypothetical protein